MIEGLRLDFKTDELRERLGDRCRYHLERADWYRGQIKNLREGGLTAGSLPNSSSSQNPLDGMEASERKHRDKAAYFKVAEAHLVDGEIYRLDDSDLHRLEIISSPYH